MSSGRVRTLKDSDIDQLVVDICFDIDFKPYIGKGLVLVNDSDKPIERIKIVLLYNKHQIDVFRIFDKNYRLACKGMFEQMYNSNDTKDYFCKLHETLDYEHRILASLGFRAYKVDKRGNYCFTIQRS